MLRLYKFCQKMARFHDKVTFISQKENCAGIDIKCQMLRPDPHVWSSHSFDIFVWG